MSGMINRLNDLRLTCREMLPGTLQRIGTVKPQTVATALRAAASDYQFLAVADYILDHNIPSFKEQLQKAAELQYSVLERFDAGDPVPPSYVSMLAYNELFDGLAVGDIPLAKRFATRMGGRPEIEKSNDRAFDIALGYALKHLVLGGDELARGWSSKLAAFSSHKEHADFAGYERVIQAMLDKDDVALAKGFEQLLAGHKRQTKGRGQFVNTPEELMSLRGLGLANLALSRGMSYESTGPFIPADLLVAPN
jgi:hypothetical protein